MPKGLPWIFTGDFYRLWYNKKKKTVTYSNHEIKICLSTPLWQPLSHVPFEELKEIKASSYCIRDYVYFFYHAVQFLFMHMVCFKKLQVILWSSKILTFLLFLSSLYHEFCDVKTSYKSMLISLWKLKLCSILSTLFIREPSLWVF